MKLKVRKLGSWRNGPKKKIYLQYIAIVVAIVVFVVVVAMAYFVLVKKR